MRFLSFSFWFAVALVAVGCTPTTTPSDASPDVGPPDAFVQGDAAVCDLECPPGRTCCLGATGPHCVDLANDITNCGICNRDCVASRRGDTCAHNQCACGDFEIGCTGAENSICCTNVVGIRPYCANPGLDLDNCGGCGIACDRAQASQCSGGMCFCGDSGGHCTGTPTDACCSDPAGAYACTDTTRDQAHCGGCGHRCSAFERCEASHCVSVLADAGAPDAP